ncbi:MAG: hypothetical protein KF767_09995 [Bdellovibrionaceae bacterium]|nr:hypothetical protein [Pseudobdellovibrionaceae bacterium]
MAALGESVTIADDVQEVFRNPAEMFGFGDLLTIEYGGQAEGGFFRSSGDTKYGIYFGNRSASFNAGIDAFNNTTPAPAVTLLNEQNPFEVFYGSKMGDSAWALSFKYSNAADKATPNRKVNTMGLRAGYNTDAFEVYAALGLAGKSEIDGVVTAQSDLSVRIGGEYFIGDSIAFVDIQQNSGKVTPNGGADAKASTMNWTIGYESKVRSETAHFFYGAKLASTEAKQDPAKQTSMKLPLYAGVEADAASWLAVRGFIQQSVLLNSSKNDNGTTSVDTEGLNDTATGLGASLKFGKVWIDGTLSANGTGNLNTDNLLATTSLNYWF